MRITKLIAAVIGVPMIIGSFALAVGGILALTVPAAYLMISIRHWFSGPTRAIAIGTALVAVGVIGGLLA